MEQNQAVSSPVSKEVSFGDWFLTLFLTAIPIVNIVLLFVWAFGANTKRSKSNWAKASLVWLAIGIFIYMILIGVILGMWTFSTRG